MNVHQTDDFPDYHPVYQEGRAARFSGASRFSCPWGLHDMYRRCLWMAGFNDVDMELRP